MVEVISENKLKYLGGEKGFNLIYLEKDYFLTVLLYLLRDSRKIYFKGGTALNKIFLNHIRLSEDLDFSCEGSLSGIEKNILEIINANKNIFLKHKFDNRTRSFFRIQVFYNGHFSKGDFVVLDVNRKSKVYLKPEKTRVPHFYDNIPKFKTNVMDLKEIVAEKVRALITRNRPRDYYDVYMTLDRGYKIDYDLVKKKLKDVKEDFDVERIFKNARKIYSRWNADVSQLTNRPLKYEIMIKKLQKEFGYKG